MAEVFNHDFIERKLRQFHHGQPPLATHRPYVRKEPMPEFVELLAEMDRDDRFRATVYAINTILIHKKIYSAEEFEAKFLEFAAKNGEPRE